MVYFLGRDVKVAISTESASVVDINSNAARGSSTSVVTDCIEKLTSSAADVFDGNSNYNPFTDVTGVELTLGKVDEDIAYMGQRTALKAEIKKETSVTLTMKKNESFFDALFNSARYGVDSSNALTNMGLTQPDTEFGYRVHVALKDGTEVISVPNCTFSEHGVTLNADGVQEETATFISHVTPIIGTGPSSDITTNL